MALVKVLVAVKTYPAISSKYDELVCTAGFLENGEWIRIYPIQFRKKSYAQQFKKYDWIEMDLVKNESDFRPESFRPISYESEIRIIGHLGTLHNWAERKRLVLGKVYYNLSDLIGEAQNKIAKLEAERLQFNLFQQPENPLKVVQKLPYKFSYIFEDNQGKKSKLMIEDWEIGQL